MLRERGKQTRRNAVFDAAETLIRRSGSVDFSLNDLSEEAGVSVGTIYNLIGSKPTVLYGLLNHSLDEIARAESSAIAKLQPIAQALAASEQAASVFERDPVLLRPLYRYLLGVYEPEHRQAFMDRAFSFWKSRLSVLETAGLLTPEVTLDDLARQHQIYFAGLLDQWVQEEIATDHIRHHARYAAAMWFCAFAETATRHWLMGEMRAAKGNQSSASTSMAPELPSSSKVSNDTRPVRAAKTSRIKSDRG